MAAEEAETTKAAPAPGGTSKLMLILVGAALLFSIVNTVLILLNPSAGKLEKSNEALKGEMSESISALQKKLEGLKSAEVEWQSVLKKSAEKPDAIYKIIRSEEGLSLVEVQQEAR